MNYVFNCEGIALSLATLEIVTPISAISINQYQIYARKDPYIGNWEDPEIQKLIPNEHLCQVLNQCYVINVNIALYVCACETDVMYHVILRVDDHVLIMADSALKSPLSTCFIGL